MYPSNADLSSSKTQRQNSKDNIQRNISNKTQDFLSVNDLQMMICYVLNMQGLQEEILTYWPLGNVTASFNEWVLFKHISANTVSISCEVTKVNELKTTYGTVKSLI